MRVLLAGVSTRAAAESAARAGFAVTAIDAFADIDQHLSVQARSLGGRFSPDAAARVARPISCHAVAYGSNFENHPEAISQLARGRTLWGNSSDVVRRAREPELLSRTLRGRDLATPDVADLPVESRRERAWLLKPRASGGGHGVRLWRHGMQAPPDCYLQEFIDGAPMSIVFVACGGRSVPIGLCRQLVGEPAFGASEFRYCGNILTAGGEDDEVVEGASAVAGAVSEEFGLVGVNGVDVMTKNGVPYAIEVNPRWCASMELSERAYGFSVFGAHAAACGAGVLPNFNLAQARRDARTVGKAVVFARREVLVGDARAWLAAGDVRDVPNPGTRIRKGRPVCTVFASGRESGECYAELVRRAERVYAWLDAMV